MKLNKPWVIAFWFYLGIIIAIAVSAYLKVLPAKSSTIPFYDTIGHFILIGFTGFLGHLALNKKSTIILGISIPIAPIPIGILTLIEECLQNFSPHRTFDPTDLVADFCGIIFFTWLAQKVKIHQSSQK
ncbi:MAG: VanZ family protein [Calothrix sp. MO_167.B12]|nr:VanZ family protein [Calothrix sp. MO_167.B12]